MVKIRTGKCQKETLCFAKLMRFSLVLSELQKQGINCQGFYLGTLFKTGTKWEKHKYHIVCVVEEKNNNMKFTFRSWEVTVLYSLNT